MGAAVSSRLEFSNAQMESAMAQLLDNTGKSEACFVPTRSARLTWLATVLMYTFFILLVAWFRLGQPSERGFPLRRITDCVGVLPRFREVQRCKGAH